MSARNPHDAARAGARHRILVVDDERKLVQGIAAYLEAGGFEVTPAYTGREALAALESRPHSLVVLDLMLPDIPGERLCQEIRTRSRIPILMLTAKVDEVSLIEGFRVGADDYMPKPFSQRELAARIQAILRRSGLDDPLAEVLSLGGGEIVIYPAQRAVRKGGHEVSLTRSEYELLLTFASHPGRVFTRGELLTRIAIHNEAPFDRAVDSHIKNLRAKIEPSAGNPRYVRTVHGVGYRLDP